MNGTAIIIYLVAAYTVRFETNCALHNSNFLGKYFNRILITLFKIVVKIYS